MRWNRWTYHLNGLLLLLPVLFIGDFLSGWEAGPAENAVRLPEQPVGACLAQAYGEPPLRPAPGGTLDFLVRFRDGCFEDVRAAFLAIGDKQPEPDRLLGAGYSSALHGGEFNLHAHVPVPQRLSGREALWLIVERWDGSLHQTSWPLFGDVPQTN